MDSTARTTRGYGVGFSDPLKQQAGADMLWHFCIQHYSFPEVQKACMSLQENYNGNINLALFFAWVENAGFTLDLKAVLALRNAIYESDGLIRRYRLMRREIKPQVHTNSYKKMLNYELSLEKFQQYEIVTCANRHRWSKTGNSALLYYCETLDKRSKFLYPSIMKGLRTFVPCG